MADAPFEARRDEPEVDEFLQILVNIVNASSAIRFPMTLQLGGLLVSGTLISGRDYFEHLSGQVEEAYGHAMAGQEGAEDATKRLSDVFRMPMDAYKSLDDIEAMSESEREAYQNRPGPFYVHLSDARLIVPADTRGIPTTGPGIYWRGRLAEVDGWVFGTVGFSEGD
jgi:hypothetical protein